MTMPEWSALPDLLLSPRAHPATDHLVVAVAHPDDETLAAGGLIHTAGLAAITTTVVVATDGEGSHPASPTHPPDRLRALRRDEVREAVGVLNPQAEVVLLGLPDSGLTAHEDALVEAVSTHIPGPGATIVSTWREDGHPDHEVVGRACAAVATRTGARHLEAPIWAWEWAPESIPVDRLTRHTLTPDTQRHKQLALRCHRSQVEPLSEDPADAAVVTGLLLGHFSQPVEAFLDSANHGGGEHHFDAMYDTGPDPWDFEDSWYEERKRAIVLATLLDRDLGQVLELGPATGLLTVALAQRAEHVIAVEVSRRALEQVGTRLAAAGLRDRVELLHGPVPQTWPARPFGTIVASEVGYFLTETQWRQTLERAAETLSTGGSLVVVNWLHPVEGLAIDGGTADRVAAGTPGLETVVEHRETDFVLRVLRRPGQRSPAAIEGRTP